MISYDMIESCQYRREIRLLFPKSSTSWPNLRCWKLTKTKLNLTNWVRRGWKALTKISFSHPETPILSSFSVMAFGPFLSFRIFCFSCPTERHSSAMLIHKKQAFPRRTNLNFFYSTNFEILKLIPEFNQIHRYLLFHPANSNSATF